MKIIIIVFCLLSLRVFGATYIEEPIETDEPSFEWTYFKSSIGISGSYVYQPTKITRVDVSLAGKNLPFVNDSIFKIVNLEGFGEYVKLDTWVVPFWNVYGLLGYNQLQVPLQFHSPFAFLDSTLSANGKGYGFGTMLAMSFLDKYFVALDYNQIKNSNQYFSQTATLKNTSLRLGLLLNNLVAVGEYTNFWIGGIYTNFHDDIGGSLMLGDLISADTCARLEVGRNACNLLRSQNIKYEMSRQIYGAWDLAVGAEQNYKGWGFRVESSLFINKALITSSISYTFADGVKFD